MVVVFSRSTSGYEQVSTTDMSAANMYERNREATTVRRMSGSLRTGGSLGTGGTLGTSGRGGSLTTVGTLGSDGSRRSTPTDAPPHLYPDMSQSQRDHRADVNEMVRQLTKEVEVLSDQLYQKEAPAEHYERIETIRKTPKEARENPPNTAATLAADSGFVILAIILGNKAHVCVRLLWLILVGIALGLLGLQLWDRITLFLVNSSFTNSEVRAVDTLAFPAVTICNLNLLRLTQLRDAGLYQTIKDTMDTGQMYHTTLTPQAQQTLSMPYSALLRNASHDKYDFIRRCSFRGKTCSAADFSDIITDQGRCYTFVPPENLRDTPLTGSGTGLSLVLNTEQYEYVLTSRSAVGIKVAFHDPWTRPEVGIRGYNVPVGSHTFFALSKKVSAEPSPCDLAAQKACQQHQSDCDTVRVSDMCHCHMGSGERHNPECTARDYLLCVRKHIGHYDRPNSCACADPCRGARYTPFISEAAGSIYAAESHVRALHGETPKLESKFHTARDLRQRIDPDIFKHDQITSETIVLNLNKSAGDIATTALNLDALHSNNKKIFTDVQNKLKTLDSNVRVNYDSFKESSHAQFYRHKAHLITRFNDILKYNPNKDTIAKSDVATLKQNITDVLDVLDKVAANKAFSIFTANDLLSELKKKIARFREDLVDDNGHGQFYKEFRDSKQFYNTHTNTILSLIQTIRGSLTANSETLKKTQDLVSPDKGEPSPSELSQASTLLSAFFTDMTTLRQTSTTRLLDELETVMQQYVKHKEDIEDFYGKIQKVLESFMPRQQAISSIFDTIKGILSELAVHYGIITKACQKPGQDYLRGDIKKTQLAQAYMGNNITTELDNTQMTLDRLRTSVNELVLRSNVTDTSINALLPRIKDFLRTDGEMQFLPSNYDSTAVTLRSLIAILSQSLSKVQGYRGELSDYGKSGRINARFYQNNFLQLNAYFRDMSHTVEIHRASYSLMDLACDIGGTLALYLGASLLTFVGLIDLTLRSICCPAYHKQ